MILLDFPQRGRDAQASQFDTIRRWGPKLILRSSIFDFKSEDLNPRRKKRPDIRRERSHNAKTISVTPPISGPAISKREDLNTV